MSQPDSSRDGLPPVEEMLRIQESIFRKNRGRIDSSVEGMDAGFRRYESRYRRWFRSAKITPTTFKRLRVRMRKAGIIYVGDYHPLRQSQKTFLKLAQSISSSRCRLMFCLEAVAGREQHVIDRYLEGRIGEDTLLRRSRFREHWGHDIWINFKPIFEFARAEGIPVKAIDFETQGGGTLKVRDEYAAMRISQAAADNPERRIMVLCGELHVAPEHLPAAVRRCLARLGLRKPDMVIFQNPEALFFDLARRGLLDNIEMVRLRAGVYAMLHTHPIVAQQSFLNWLDGEETASDYAGMAGTFKECVRGIAKFLDLDPGEDLEKVDIRSYGDLGFLGRLRQSGEFKPEELREINRQIQSSESYYIPRARIVYLADVSLNHAAEEAAHFLRHVCAEREGAEGGEELSLVDDFYFRVVNEAIGFLGSKIINPKRKCRHEGYFRRLLRQADASGVKADENELRIARLVVRHKSIERSGKIAHSGREFELRDVDDYRALTHILGYILGDKLYYALLKERISKDLVRALFIEDIEEEGRALAVYLELLGKVGGIRVPKRF